MCQGGGAGGNAKRGTGCRDGEQAGYHRDVCNVILQGLRDVDEDPFIRKRQGFSLLERLG